MTILLMCLSLFIWTDVEAKANRKTDSYFSENEIATREFVRIKRAEWSACHREIIKPLFVSGAHQPISDFLETTSIIYSLQEMEIRNLTQGSVKNMPWSGDYWSYAAGILGSRSFDEDFEENSSWLDRYNFIQGNSAQDILEKHGQAAVFTLSPSEKYDLLTGQNNMPLTAAMWAQGKVYYDKFGDVESWMGICHGWAAASIMEPRPTNALDIRSWDEKWQIHLVPSEIKGIASHSWATNLYSSVVLGERCDKTDPVRDENGRLVDPECFDLNPATWHLAMINQVGVSRRSFVMDATFDHEVWNFPIRTYKYTYFNVNTRKEEKDLKKAVIPSREFNKDPYRKYREKEAAFIVGIAMTVSYATENFAGSQDSDSPVDDSQKVIVYSYDLELDTAGNIIGGEWHQDVHPDFIWRPLAGSSPRSPFDAALNVEAWDGHGVIPNDWVEAAKKSSPWGLVLNTISRALLLKSADHLQPAEGQIVSTAEPISLKVTDSKVNISR